jgi:hypothetical protein
MADIVGIFDANFNQLFTEARPLKAAIKEEAKLMTHPVETGASVTDHRIIQPVEIDLSLIVQSADYKSIYNRIKATYLNGDSLNIQTKTGVYKNMVIASIPHDEDPEMFDALTIAMKLTEVLYVTAQYAVLPARKVKNKTKASTTDSGEQQAAAEKKDSSLARDTAKAAKAFFGRKK